VTGRIRVALVGAGVIGGGWAGRLVENGVDVVVHDPHPEARRRLEEVLENAKRAWARLTLAPRRRGRVTFAGSLAEAVDGADLIQESAPEDEELKRRLLGEIETHAPARALVCSSTSGLLPTRLQAEMTHPDRFLVGHPFNPVYLLPLVELVAGERTSEGAVEAAADFYSSLGMKPLRVRHEIDGFIGDRLLEALWREALWLVHDGVATVGEVDEAIRYGPGLRWAQMGPFLTYRTAGGEGGMRHFLEQFGPALEWPWTKLSDVPALTDELIETIAEQSDEQAMGLSARELERLRDDNIVAILHALRNEGYGAGAVLRAHEAVLFDEAHLHAAADVDESQPLWLYEDTVRSEWVDYNGHMTESRYLEALGNATDAFLRHVGLDAAYLADGHSLYTVETHIRHLAEALAGEPLAASTQVLGADEKRLHLFHTLVRPTTETVLCTGEHMLLHVDTRAARASAMVQPVAGAVAAAAAAHASLPRPEGVGQSVRELRTAEVPG
jgi:carnitine 3-dehydrogenase / betainyl-CoA thioesterase